MDSDACAPVPASEPPRGAGKGRARRVVTCHGCYDGLHGRIAKIVKDTGNWDRTQYYSCVSRRVLEKRIANDVSSQYKDTPATADKYQYVWDIRYIDAPVCRDENKNADGDCIDAATGVQGSNTGDEHLYYCQDANFNVTALVDGYDGAVIERYLYDPYGKVSVRHGVRNAAGDSTTEWGDRGTSNTFANEILYCGYRFDPESGLYHVRYRYYHPTLGRWMTRDPIGHVPEEGLYNYVRSRPVGLLDPSGLESQYPGFTSIPVPNLDPLRQARKEACKDRCPKIGDRQIRMDPPKFLPGANSPDVDARAYSLADGVDKLQLVTAVTDVATAGAGGAVEGVVTGSTKAGVRAGAEAAAESALASAGTGPVSAASSPDGGAGGSVTTVVGAAAGDTGGGMPAQFADAMNRILTQQSISIYVRIHCEKCECEWCGLLAPFTYRRNWIEKDAYWYHCENTTEGYLRAGFGESLGGYNTAEDAYKNVPRCMEEARQYGRKNCKWK